MFSLIPTPIKIYIVLGLLALMAAATGAAYVFGRSDGATINEAAWQKREAQINAASAAKILERSKEVRAEVQAAAEADAKGSAAYQKKLQEKNHEQERVIAGLRDGTAKLYVGASCPASGGDGVLGAASGAGGHNGETRVELSVDASRFFVERATRADKVVEQLTACQLRLEADRKPPTAKEK